MNPDETLDAPGKDRATVDPRDRDASDIIEGDIGEARLKDPKDQSDTGADLTKLPKADAGPAEGSEADRSSRGNAV